MSRPTLAFLLYDNRSGSTLLSALLNRYRGVAVAQESDFVGHILEYPHALRTAADTDGLVDYLLCRTRLPELGLSPEALRERAAGVRSRAGLIQAVASVYFEAHDPDASMWVIKDPKLYFHLGTLRQLFPACRFVQIVRDGRAVFASKRRSRSVLSGRAMDGNLFNAARRWRAKLALADRSGAVSTVRYEDVVLDTEPTLERLIEALGVAPEGRVQTKAQADYARAIGGDYRSLHTNVGTEANEGLVNQWRERLAPEDVYLYERANRAALQHHGYKLAQLDRTHSALFRVRVWARAVAYGLGWAVQKLDGAAVQARSGQFGAWLRAKRAEHAAFARSRAAVAR